MKIAAVIIFVAVFAGTKAQSESCHNEGEVLTCQCFPNEELEVDYETEDRITSLNVLSCASAELPVGLGSSSKLSETVTSIIIENITDTVEFQPILKAKYLGTIKFLNVGCLKDFESMWTFNTFTRLDYFHIENTAIGKFNQIFNGAEVKKVLLKNVTISNLQGLEFSSMGNGTELQIIDSYINVTKNTSLVLQTFDNVKITNTTFNFHRGGSITISGKHIHLTHNTFLKVRVDVTGKHMIQLSDTCAEGHGSAIRVSLTEAKGHHGIKHYGNRVPTEIIYKCAMDNDHVTHPTMDNDHDYICPGAKCDCSPTRPTIISKMPVSYGETIHEGTGRGFFLCFIIIASGILARI